MIHQTEISLKPLSRGFHLITREVMDALPELPEIGMVNLFIRHTSAGLTINENADPDVRGDLNRFTDYLVPENLPMYRHTMEGPDDMPAHIKSSFYGTSLNIPVRGHKLGLGTWQGIYLCEFRDQPGNRRIIITVMS